MTGLEKVVQKVGSKYRLAKLLGLTPQAVYAWDKVHCDYVAEVRKITGLSVKQIRPDFWE